MKNPVIKIKNLCKKFDDKKVLTDVNLEINPGQIVSYIGPNGAGKTTTIKILLGMVGDYEGEIEIFGNKISPADIEYKRNIGYVPEGGEIYENLTGWEYIQFIGEVYNVDKIKIDERSKLMAESFGMEGAFNDRISSYSKGMKQKLLIITALIHDPDFIILDEPLNGLDANSVMIFKEILIKLAENGKTIFYSSHLMDVVEKISDRIILISEGSILADGTFHELQQKSKEGSLERIFNQLTGFNESKEIADSIVKILGS